MSAPLLMPSQSATHHIPCRSILPKPLNSSFCMIGLNFSEPSTQADSICGNQGGLLRGACYLEQLPEINFHPEFKYQQEILSADQEARSLTHSSTFQERHSQAFDSAGKALAMQGYQVEFRSSESK